jgi:hypothetical protein
VIFIVLTVIFVVMFVIVVLCGKCYEQGNVIQCNVLQLTDPDVVYLE